VLLSAAEAEGSAIVEDALKATLVILEGKALATEEITEEGTRDELGAVPIMNWADQD